MCGGYTTPEGWQEIHLDLDPASIPLHRQFAVRPFDPAPIVVAGDRQPIGVRADQWSLIPPGSDTPHPKYSTFNARIERLTESSLWRSVLRNHCLVPADGFYERVPVAGQRKKQPWYVCRRDRSPVLFAGLWSRWDAPDGKTLLNFTVITTRANALLERIGHPRCPVIVPEALYEDWLHPDAAELELLLDALAQPPAAHCWQAWPVSPAVNYRDRNGPELIEPVGEPVTVDD